MTKDEALRLALEALGPTPPDCCGCQAEWQIAITAIKAALEANDEPVAWVYESVLGDDFGTPSYVKNIRPKSASWIGLTDEEIMEMLDYGQYGRVPQYARNFVDAIEAKLKEKNNG